MQRKSVPLSMFPLLWTLATLMCLLGSIGQGEAKTTIPLGGAGGNSWQQGGGGIDPVYKVGSTEASSGNTPGAIIDFDFTTPEGEARIGWIFPESADVTENIAPGLLDRGGAVTAPNLFENLAAELVLMLDDKGETAFTRKSTETKHVQALGVALRFDLGARFGVSRLRFFPRNADIENYPTPDYPFQDDFLRGYELFLNDGSVGTQSAGLPVFTSIVLESQNDEPIVDLQIEPQYVRFIQLRSRTTIGFEIAEFQDFGAGFVPVAAYLSDVFGPDALGLGPALALWGNIRWEEESRGDPIRSRAEISTRTGVDDTPLVFNRIRIDLDGEQVPWPEADEFDSGSPEFDLVSQLDDPELSARDALIMYRDLALAERNAISLTWDDYKGLKDAEKGAIRDDIQSWSSWTPPYSPAGRVSSEEEVTTGVGGIPILSPGPRPYLQFKVDFVSDNLFSAKGIGSLSFDFSTPTPAQRIVAEISPREAVLGEVTDFTYTVVPDIRPGVDQGFSSFEITTPVQVASIEAVELSLADGSSMAEDFSQEDLAEFARPISRGPFSIDLVEVNRFQISFPRIEASRIGSGQLASLTVAFKGVVLRTGTAFSGRALPEDPAEDFAQEVIGGNVDELTQGAALILNPANLTVQVPLKTKFLINAAATPRVFTPNGDLINDFTTLHYDITSLIGGALTTVRIYDLSGRLIKEAHRGSDRSGRYSARWDGTDAQENLVPPGVYIYRLAIEADARDEQLSGTLAVVY